MKKKENKTKEVVDKELDTKKVDTKEVVLKDQELFLIELNKIFVLLVIIAVILGLILIVDILSNGSSNNNNNNKTIEEIKETEENEEYDVSMFDTLTTTDAISKIKEGNTEIVYIGRSTCGYCVKFLPVLQQAQNEYKYKTIYIDLEEMTRDDQESLLALDNDEGYIKQNFGYTPLVLIFKDGKLSEGWVGYSEYSEFSKFLDKNEIKK